MSKRRRLKGRICPTPDKVFYVSEAVALDFLAAVRARSIREEVPTRAYLCQCGSWHLTRWDTEEFETTRVQGAVRRSKYLSYYNQYT